VRAISRPTRLAHSAFSSSTRTLCACALFDSASTSSIASAVVLTLSKPSSEIAREMVVTAVPEAVR
jgi:hypothetical protein